MERAALKALCLRSDSRGALQAGSHVVAILLSGSLLRAARGGWLAIPLFMLHGVLLNFLYAGQHELSHWTVFRTPWPNEWLGRLFGFVVFYPRTDKTCRSMRFQPCISPPTFHITSSIEKSPVRHRRACSA